ncbi:hypothetical protein LWI28_024968 [Acer negundo]|uniref:Bifunctional inhibitor/plant lipid transfer protein/seed storage helical domain-containing protein n=1 Tax=Acer negundo TaxID=4023 RepID=A0AAD5NQR6_ACENE|nr:hypothetical protein LWI28_024968 [Acer negundo]
MNEVVSGAVLSPSQCMEERRLGVNACKTVVFGQAPSAACCERVRVSHFECVCPVVTSKLTSLISVNSVINLLKRCGRRVPRHFKCGRRTVVAVVGKVVVVAQEEDIEDIVGITHKVQAGCKKQVIVCGPEILSGPVVIIEDMYVDSRVQPTTMGADQADGLLLRRLRAAKEPKQHGAKVGKWKWKWWARDGVRRDSGILTRAQLGKHEFERHRFQFEEVWPDHEECGDIEHNVWEVAGGWY